jgi:hypothetical protein
MSTISLEARKRIIAENISIVDDSSVIDKIERILNNFTPSVNPFTVKELERRAAKSEKAIEEERIYSTGEIRNKLGL